jgi:ADP-ribosyl-[dinitrogen reductase] hydrolase
MVPMPTPPSSREWIPPKPVPASYWVVPGRLLVGEHPGSYSRAEAMERLRSFLAAGVTCFIDLTQPEEIASYEALLPFATPSGRRVEYLRQPILDHDVPEDRATMERILVLLDDALAAGHVVYVHCRAGIGRSATVAGCWLANQRGSTERALQELREDWKQSSQSNRWTEIPETEAQEEFVRAWLDGSAAATTPATATEASVVGRRERLRGAWLGLALGDAIGAGRTSGRSANPAYTQPTALALCLGDSLLGTGRCDARDQIERYLRWQREGLHSATGEPGQASPDVAKALGTYLWRRLPMAGSHDPRDRSAACLPRVVAAATFSARDPAAAIALAGECSRTTHQSPIAIDACRYFAALLLDAFQGRAAAQVLDGVPEPVPGCWGAKPLKREVAAVAKDAGERRTSPAKRDTAGDVLEALLAARAAVRSAADFEEAVRIACESGGDPALDGALAGALYGALYGEGTIPRERLAALAGLQQVQQLADQLATRDERPGA